MADRRSEATKNALKPPSTTQTSAQKSAQRIESNKTRGGFVSQKELALQSGGRFSEGGSITQVNIQNQSQKKQGQNFQITLNERLGFSDSADTKQIINRRVGSGSSSASAAISPETITKQKKKGKDLSINLNESFGFGEPSKSKRIGAVAPFGGAFTAGSDLFKTKKDDFIGPKKPKEGSEKTLDDIFTAGQELGKQLFSDAVTSKELTLGSGFAGSTGGGVKAVTPEAKSLEKFIGANYAPNEFEQKIFEGKFSEIDLSNPKTQGQALKLPAYLLAPTGIAKGVSLSKGAIGGFREAQEIRNIEKFLGQKGLTEKISPDLFFTGGGTEKSASALFVTQRGKSSNFFTPGTTTKIKPSNESILTPSKAGIQGKLDITTQKDLGLTFKPSEFKSFIGETTPKGRRTFAKGQFENQLKIIARGEEIQSTDITRIPVEKGFKVPQQKQLDSIQNLFARKGKPIAFAQTKAEKAVFKDLTGPRQTGKQKTPFDTGSFKPPKGGAGSTGKANVFTKQQTKELKDFVKSTAPQTKQQSSFKPFLFSSEQSEQQIFRQPPQKSSGAGKLSFKDEISLTLGPKQKKGGNAFGLVFEESLGIKTGKKQNQGLIGGLTFKDELSTLTGTKTKQPQKELFKFREDFNFKLTPGEKFDFIPDGPPLPPPFVPPKEPLPKFGFPPFGRPISLSQFAGEGGRSSKKVFGAFGISSNINVGRLPGPLSEFSTSSKVFGKLDKRDKKYQDALFGTGKKKRKSSKTKKRKSKSKRKRR